MALLAKEEGGSSFEPVPEGLHRAICYAVYDVGTQFSERFNSYARKIFVIWELPDLRIEIDGNDKPMAISKQYTLSLHEKSNLRQDLEGWRGKSFTDQELAGFDVLKLLGVNCQIQVIHKKGEKRTYANIKTILPLPKDKWKEPENKINSFSFDDSKNIPEEMPDWIFKIAKEADEYEYWCKPTDMGDDVPIEVYEEGGDIPF